MGTKKTLLDAEETHGLGQIEILHPTGTFSLTPASMLALRSIGRHQDLLRGAGIDWGPGTGCLAIAAARIGEVERVVGLEILEANVGVARENVSRNGLEGKVEILLSDSYAPFDKADSAKLHCFEGKVDFIVANPDASEGDDGLGYRREVLRGGQRFLVKNGVVFLSVSSQYGLRRVQGLSREIPGFVYKGVLESTEWVPFDLDRAYLLRCLYSYAEEERKGGLEYVFQDPVVQDEKVMNARAALAHFEQTGQSPLSKWQVHLFRFSGSPTPLGSEH